MNNAHTTKPSDDMLRISVNKKKTTPSTRVSTGDKRSKKPNATIASLMCDLASRDGTVRQRAREKLVGIGKPAVPALTERLWATGSQLRWEAGKALIEIADGRAARALVACLEDKDAGTRWVAAEALIALKHDALVPLLEALIDQSDSVWVREGAHHVLHDLAEGELREILGPVLAALEGPAPDTVAPVFAAEALEELATGES